jgi:membrane-bound metal-dependent hydrolase YbcI (DUF457 family)
MPLPLGHAAIGVATCEITTGTACVPNWKRLLFVSALANLPDLDILMGLVFTLNGNAFHRGPTHSLVFALLSGFIAAYAGNKWLRIRGIGFRHCFLMVLSHVVADAFLTDSSVSFFWPLEIHWSAGHAGWSDVLHTVFFDAYRDTGLVLCCGIVIIMHRLFRFCFTTLRAGQSSA